MAAEVQENRPDARQPDVHSGLVPLAALLLPTTLFVVAPSNIIFRNLDDIPYDVGTVRFFGLASLVLAGCLVPLHLGGRRLPALRFASRVCGALALLPLLFNVMGAVSALDSLPVGGAVIVDCLVGGLVVALFVSAPWGGYIVVASAIGAVLLVLSLWNHGSAYIELRGREAQVAAYRQVQLDLAVLEGPGNVKGNVYHIVLDGFQREIFPMVQDRYPEAVSGLSDFTFFPRFTAAYTSTVHSLPNVAGGWYYGGEKQSIERWRDASFSERLWRDLTDHGVSVSLYPYHETGCPPSIGPCTSAVRTARGGGVRAQRAVRMRKTVDLWFNSILPLSARVRLNTASPDDRGAATVGRGPFSLTSAVNIPGVPAALGDGGIDPGNFPALSLRNFDRMLEREPERASRGEYVFLHLILPHYPYVASADCELRAEMVWHDRVIDDYVAQAACAMRSLGRLVSLLRSLDRYDDALIIVHADHGVDPVTADQWREHYPDWVENANTPEFTPATRARIDRELEKHGEVLFNASTVPLRSGALLLVKFPGGAGVPDAESLQPLMVDVAPTVLSHAGIDTEKYEGLALGALSPDTEREVPYFHGMVNLGAQDAGVLVPPGGAFEKFVLRPDGWNYVEDVEAAL